MINKVLIVDDDTDFITLTRLGLIKNHFTVSVANSVMEAKAILNQSSFDLILCDISMPGESGLSLAEFIKEKQIQVYFAFMTGHTQEALKSKQIDTFPVLHKPFNAQQLITFIANQKWLEF